MESVIKNKKILIVLAVVSFILYLYFVQYPKAQQAYEELLIVYEEINAFPQATRIRGLNVVKYASATVGATYYTEVNQSTILHHYNEELLNRGWEYVYSKRVIDGGRDYGGKEVVYKKGNLCIEIHHFGDIILHEAFYYVAIVWGNTRLC